jgi:hypothetical protein
MDDGIHAGFDKILPEKWVILGQELTENNFRKCCHNARSATSLGRYSTLCARNTTMKEISTAAV